MPILKARRKEIDLHDHPMVTAMQNQNEDADTSERLNKMMQGTIALRAKVTEELFEPRWKESRRRSARYYIAAAEGALDSALRNLNAAAEADRKICHTLRQTKNLTAPLKGYD